MDWSVIPNNLSFLLAGLIMTFKIALFSIGGAFPLGIILALCRLSRRSLIYWPASAFIFILRSNPLFVVIFWFYFMAPLVVGRSVPAFTSVIIAFIFFESAYFAEIIRAGIQSIRMGQREAGLSTGLTYLQTMRHVILPPAIKNMIPVLVTQTISLCQDTSMAFIIGVREFLRSTSLVDARVYRSFELYTFAAVVYFVIFYTGSVLSRRLEVRMEAKR